MSKVKNKNKYIIPKRGNCYDIGGGIEQVNLLGVGNNKKASPPYNIGSI